MTSHAGVALAGVALAGVALVRRPASTLSCGLLTHQDPAQVDLDLAYRQHEAYRAALADAGWTVRQVPDAEGCPDSVFVEDTVVVSGPLAVVTRPGAEQRRPETAGTEAAVRELGLRVARIAAPGTLDGGDVLQTADVVYVGVGGRTNLEGLEQLRAHLGRTVVPVRLGPALHLKSAVSALPDGTLLVWPERVDPSVFPAAREVPEASGARVLPIGGDRVLIAKSAPRTADLLAELGCTPVVLDISEFEKLEGSVTCISVLVPGAR